MSTSSRSWNANRRLGSAHGTRDSASRRRDAARARPNVVSFDEAYSFALRVALLHHLLQPRKKKKEYISKPAPAARASTAASSIDLMRELIPGGSSSSSSHKLPNGFRRLLEERMSGVLRGVEKLPGYADSSLKRTFAEAYTAFTARDFQKTIDKDRKVEPLILIFCTSATRSLSRRGTTPDDHSSKLMVDRHLAMFIRLLASILRDQGADRDRADLIARLSNLEKKLLTNDQDLSLDSPEQEKTCVEVEVPLSCEVKDMHMVQVVGCIFGKANSAVQADIDANKTAWTEEAALKDSKAYQFRLSANMAGTLQRSDFDVDDSFEQWRKHETSHLVQLFADILAVRPDLRGASSSHDRNMPIRPQSLYAEEHAFAEIGRMLGDPEARMDGLDQSMSLGSLSLDDANGIRSVDEPNYTFIPTHPRPVYKTILQYAMSFDLLHSDPMAPYPVLSDDSVALLEELSVRWRIPQFTRCITLVEAAARKFLDQEIDADQLMMCIRYAKAPGPPKKPPLIQFYGTPLPDIESKRWTMTDLAGYKQALKDVHDALLRELHTLLLQCYDPKPPSVAVIRKILMEHIYNDEAFAPRQAEEEEFSQQLEAGLRKSAKRAYEGYLASSIPSDADEWTFAHIVKLGQQVTGLCEKIKKRYRKNPEMFGVNPFKVLVEVMFPIFENDTRDFISRVLQLEKERGEEIALEDGFALYEELVGIRNIHNSSLPNQPFFFHIEDLLEVFVWRWIKTAEDKVNMFVENSIKQDQFQVRTESPGDIAPDSQRHSTSIVDTFAMLNQTIDFVLKLKWQDEVHRARFMTALAKIISIGIGRYCEMVDQSFAREMDRQISQDTATAAAKTTQERLLQYAKDTWNTKEKVEPFQFYPESFVKFNNVEYAMQELDKLNQVMNVEACAELLATVDAAKQVNKRSTKFVFTIKIVEAEDLKACDPTGFSDPYVVLCDEYQKRLAKTRVIAKNLNPRWDESVDITVSGPLNVIATIWDHDMFGDHDFVGRTSLKLDPIHFSDYLPREFWLDLDTQGRLLLRVSMEGERDDIQFYFGKAFRHLKRTERDMVRGITDKLTTHINASLSRTTLGSVLNRGIAASMVNLWKKRQSSMPAAAPVDPAAALQALFTYFDDNFEIMKKTLTEATMMSVMTRLWKEVLLAMENLLVPPLSDKPSAQKPLTQAELDVVYHWLELLYRFFHARDDATGEVLGIPEDVLKSPKWLELRELNFFYFDTTDNLIRLSERMAAANMERARQQQQQEQRDPARTNRLSAPATLGATLAGAGAFGSLGTIRRGKSIMMSRNLGTMRRAKEEKRKEAQADPSDDIILRILRMRPDAAGYLKERYRQKERMQAQQAAAMIVRQSIHHGWNSGPAFGGALYGRNNLPRR